MFESQASMIDMQRILQTLVNTHHIEHREQELSGVHPGQPSGRTGRESDKYRTYDSMDGNASQQDRNGDPMKKALT